MFDKLIESEPEGADFRDRRRYFLTSSVIVGVLFLAAVVVSIFAADFSLGSKGFELVEMIAPPEMAVAPEVDRPRSNPGTAQSQSDLPSRTTNMARSDEYNFVPTSTSSVPNSALSRPYERFRLGPADNNGSGGRNAAPGSGNGLSVDQTALIGPESDTEAPPRRTEPIKPRGPVSKGVINGQAKSLPKPQYPAAATVLHIEGKVDVQVTIDESGKVISAKAVSGHPLLRSAAEKAAWGARFSPTYLSEIPVKVTGVIVYNFNRN